MAGLADLADVLVELARHLDVRSPEVRDLVPPTGTETLIEPRAQEA